MYYCGLVPRNSQLCDARFMSNVCPSIPWSSNLATFGSSRSRPLAGSFRSFDRRRGAAAQIRSGRERGGGGGGLREIMRGRKHFLGANRPPARPGVLITRSAAIAPERETFRPSSDSVSEMTKVEQPADSTQYSPMPFSSALNGTDYPSDRPTAGTSDRRAHA